MLIPLLAALLTGASIFLLVLGLSGALQPETEDVSERIARYGTRQVSSLQELELEEPFTERVLRPLIRSMAQAISRFTPQQVLENQRALLEAAGNPNNWTPADFLGVRGLAAIVLGALPGILLFLSGASFLRVIGFSAGFALLGFLLPGIWINRKIQDRRKQILKTLPDALDLMTISVEAGLGFDQAMSKVAEKWGDNELAKEFNRVITEIRLGKTRREALRDLAERTQVDEIRGFVAAVIQADQLGVSIAKVLRTQSEQMRIRRRQRAEEQAQQASIKMLFPLVFLIFPAIFIVLLGPAIPRIMDALGAL
ncbi:tight adherence protein C [Ardenticatena maritima]|uniref:Tight adherence protein C n=1 Tax=Ardenticatena maritima TaxID=872965 RepID=A0A0M9UD89_9CHLR|nr:type II secretion system F family protein [Ardenticatena maritima]KPL88243.1 type II secretion system protein [Ardenticatena maritima]GAP63717.1 tight adherence protein C [Ardenticatena maritima]